MISSRAFDELRQDILRRVRTVMPDGRDAAAIDCDIEPDGPRLVVHLFGGPCSDRVEKAMAVRVLDAIWKSGHTHGQVSVEYHAITKVAR